MAKSAGTNKHSNAGSGNSGSGGSSSKQTGPPKAGKKGGPPKSNKKAGTAAKDAQLLSEILKLGGTEEDLLLVADVNSGDEEEAEDAVVVGPTGDEGKLNKPDAGLQDELQRMLVQFGFTKSGGKKNAPAVNVNDIDTDDEENDDNGSGGARGAAGDSARIVDGRDDDNDGDNDNDNDGEDEQVIPVNDGNLFKKHDGKLMIEPNPVWHEISVGEIDVNETMGKKLNPEAMSKRKLHAQQLLDAESVAYSTSTDNDMSKSDRKYLSTLMTSGTLNDKVSALTLLIQESPLHHYKSISQLVNMATKKNRREAQLGINNLKDLYIGSLLPSNRKLKYFEDQPHNAIGVNGKHLVLWIFEDIIKRQYFEMIGCIENILHDPVGTIKKSMLQVIFDLLVNKPEQEQNLLRLLITKLGDGDNSIAAKCSHLLLQLLTKHHPNMKSIVVKFVEELVLTKAGDHHKAKYYSMITLNQIVLSSRESTVANQLVSLYFTIFRSLLALPINNENENDNGDGNANANGNGDGNDDDDSDSGNADKNKNAKNKGKKNKKNDEFIARKGLRGTRILTSDQQVHLSAEESANAKLMGAVLTGLNRALPFSRMEDSEINEHVSTLFKVAHMANFSSAVQALSLLQQICSVRPALIDRFHRALYEMLLDTRLALASSKQSLFLNVLSKALLSDNGNNTNGANGNNGNKESPDVDVAKLAAFVKRMLQISISFHQPPFIIGILYLVSELLRTNPSLRAILRQPESQRLSAKLDRFIAQSAQNGKSKDKAKDKDAGENKDDDDDDEMEHFVDAPDVDEEDGTGTGTGTGNGNADAVVNVDGIDKEPIDQIKEPVSSNAENSVQIVSSGYDSLQRDPRYAKADRSCVWELISFTKHYHPTVALYASTILAGKPVAKLTVDNTSSSDGSAKKNIHVAKSIVGGAPNLHTHSVAHFLDKFVFRNAKSNQQQSASASASASATSENTRGSSLMQPLTVTTVDYQGQLKTVRPNFAWMRNEKIAQLSEKQMLKMDLDSVPVDDQFFHRFYSLRHARDARATIRKKNQNEEDADGSDIDVDDNDGEESENIKNKKKALLANDESGLTAALKTSAADDELAEDEIWQAMMRSMPNAGELDDDIDDDGDSDIGDSDIDDDFAKAMESDDEDDDDDDDIEGASDFDDGSDDDNEEVDHGGFVDSDDDDDDDDDDTAAAEEEEDHDGDDDDEDMDGLLFPDSDMSGSDIDDEPVNSRKNKTADKGAKRKRTTEEATPAEALAAATSATEGGKRRKKIKLPAFASYEDYAALVESNQGLD